MKTLIITTLVLFLTICFTTKSNSFNNYRAKYSTLVLKWENSTDYVERVELKKQMEELKTRMVQIKKYRKEYSKLVDDWDKTEDPLSRIDIENKIEVLKVNHLHLFKP